MSPLICLLLKEMLLLTPIPIVLPTAPSFSKKTKKFNHPRVLQRLFASGGSSQRLHTNSGLRFIPFVISQTGALAPEAKRLMTELSDAAKANHRWFMACDSDLQRDISWNTQLAPSYWANLLSAAVAGTHAQMQHRIIAADLISNTPQRHRSHPPPRPHYASYSQLRSPRRRS
jgi:hypothetical protein